MQIDEEIRKMKMQDMGMIAIRTPAGINALYQGLASGKEQVMVMEGNLEQLRYSIGLGSIPREITKPKEKVSVSDNSLRVQTLNFVKQILANAIKLSSERIQLETPFEKYGIDSILQLNIIRELEKGKRQKEHTFNIKPWNEIINLDKNKEGMFRDG